MRSDANVVVLGHSRDKIKGYLGASVKTRGEDDSKACTCGDVMLSLEKDSCGKQRVAPLADHSTLGRGPQLELRDTGHDLSNLDTAASVLTRMEPTSACLGEPASPLKGGFPVPLFARAQVTHLGKAII